MKNLTVTILSLFIVSIFSVQAEAFSLKCRWGKNIKTKSCNLRPKRKAVNPDSCKFGYNKSERRCMGPLERRDYLRSKAKKAAQNAVARKRAEELAQEKADRRGRIKLQDTIRRMHERERNRRSGSWGLNRRSSY